MNTTKLFTAVAQGYDPKSNIVFLCQDAAGFYVYKPATGYKSTHGVKEAANQWFERQVLCGHANSFYQGDDAPADGELYEEQAIAPGAGKAVVPPAVKSNAGKSAKDKQNKIANAKLAKGPALKAEAVKKAKAKK